MQAGINPYDASAVAPLLKNDISPSCDDVNKDETLD